ncbi:MAG: cell division protein ZapA [Gammaproteobacteria bacterium]
MKLEDMQNNNFAIINIFGRDLKVKCSPDEKSSLQKAATYLNDKMHSLSSKASLASIENVAVITALNLAHEVINLEKKTTDNTSSRIDTLIQQISTTLDDKIEQLT